MALTRSFLKGMGLTEEQVSAIIEEHTSSTDALKAQRDSYKEQAEKATSLESELNGLKSSGSDWESKYKAEKKSFEDYKAEIKAQETATARTSKIRDALKAMNIGEKHLDSVLKLVASDEGITIGEDGNLSDMDAFQKSVTEQFSDFISQTQTQGASVSTPPANTGSAYTLNDVRGMTREQINANWASIKSSLKGE